MDIFFTGFITLLVMAAIYYIVFFAFVFYWHLKIASVFVVPVVLTFQIFLKCFIALVIISLILYYAPYLINLSGL